MNQGFIKVAAGTPQVTVADCKANTSAILKVIREMETQHAKLMVLPELCITGYTCQDLFLQRRLLDSAWESLLTIAEETADVDALMFVGSMGKVAISHFSYFLSYSSGSARVTRCPSAQVTT